MLPDMLNDNHFLLEKQTLRLATYWLYLYLSSKNNLLFFSCLPIQFRPLVLQMLWKHIVIFKLPCP